MRAEAAVPSKVSTMVGLVQTAWIASDSWEL